MRLPAVVESLDKVEEKYRASYELKDGKYTLMVDGLLPGMSPSTELSAANSKVVEFRDNNISLKAENDRLKPLLAKFEGIDPDAARTALTEVGKLKDKGVKNADDVTKLIGDAVQAAIKPLAEQVTSLTEGKKSADSRADQLTLRTTIGEKFSKAGGRGNALDYIVGRATESFVVKDGQVQALPNKFSSTRPSEPLSVEEWLTTMTKEADFAFQPSGGGGAEHGRQQPGTTHPAGQTVLKNPTPAQLGQYGKEIAAKTMRVEYDAQQ